MSTPDTTQAKARTQREDYTSPAGIAKWWDKDGLWHIALPCPEIVNGLRTGGYRYTENGYPTRAEAIAAIKEFRHE